MKALTSTIVVTVGGLAAVAVAGVVTKLNESKESTEPQQEQLATVDQDLLQPVAHAPAVEYDFGVMAPDTNGYHTFEIYNHGDSDLTLRVQGETCHCVDIDLRPPVVPPGKKADVMIEWHTSVEANEYRHGATVRTNDPDNQDIKFRVNGRVKTVLGTFPTKLIFDRMAPDESTTLPLTLFSQEWDSFEVAEIESSLESLSWTIEPASDELLEQWRATSGYRLYVTTPDDLPLGTFQELMRFKVHPEGDLDRVEEVETTVHGNVKRRLSVYGDKRLKDDGTVYLGVIDRGVDQTVELMLHNFDKEQIELPVTSIVVEPDYIEAEVVSDQFYGRPHIYLLKVKVPGELCEGNHLGYDAGSIRLEFDHPRIQSLDLKIEFAVLEEN